MKNVFSFLKRAPKKVLGAVLVAGLAATVPAGILLAWGPNRPTFTIAKPADYVTFNSITDNPNVGDERNFVVAKDAANTANGGWQDQVTVQPGKEYIVRVYVHNNAADNLNLKAVNTRVSASVSTATGTSVPVSGFVSADNARPQKVWDDVVFTSNSKFNLVYVPGSAEIFNNGYAAGGNGAKLPDSIVTSAGALVGFNGPDGVVPGCFKYASYVYFKVKPQFAPVPNFEVQKMVSPKGANKYVKSLSAKPGEVVDFRIKYKNTGDTQQDNVVIKDRLPAGMVYVKGSTRLYNNQNPNGKTLSDNLTDGVGVNIGSHAPGGASYIIFSAQVVSENKLQCGDNQLTDVARAETPNGSKEDTANVNVNRQCAEKPEQPKQPPEQPKQPELPTTLPKTGPETIVGGLFGTSALGYGIHSWLASRRSLRQALKR
ncbi:MAG: DUF11 domain-containing protein [Candidatus Chaera renei]|uniref:DUF11 domain-containing protein n=1 Tax=Candidatus Chaera renei TaxID=2506947 RepID=A0A4Q0AK92_9BACT|nr:MAG: DUF11 domain-containing protein [Candidatus Chaera renei]